MRDFNTHCKHGHSYAEYRPYRDRNGRIVKCSQCRRLRDTTLGRPMQKRPSPKPAARESSLSIPTDTIIALGERIERESRADLKKDLEAELAKLISPNKEGAGA